MSLQPRDLNPVTLRALLDRVELTPAPRLIPPWRTERGHRHARPWATWWFMTPVGVLTLVGLVVTALWVGLSWNVGEGDPTSPSLTVVEPAPPHRPLKESAPMPHAPSHSQAEAAPAPATRRATPKTRLRPEPPASAVRNAPSRPDSPAGEGPEADPSEHWLAARGGNDPRADLGAFAAYATDGRLIRSARPLVGDTTVRFTASTLEREAQATLWILQDNRQPIQAWSGVITPEGGYLSNGGQPTAVSLASGSGRTTFRLTTAAGAACVPRTCQELQVEVR